MLYVRMFITSEHVVCLDGWCGNLPTVPEATSASTATPSIEKKSSGWSLDDVKTDSKELISSN